LLRRLYAALFKSDEFSRNSTTESLSCSGQRKETGKRDGVYYSLYFFSCGGLTFSRKKKVLCVVKEMHVYSAISEKSYVAGKTQKPVIFCSCCC